MTSLTIAGLPDKFVLYADQKLVRLMGGRPWIAGSIIAIVSFASFLSIAFGFGIYDAIDGNDNLDISRTFGMDPYTWAALITSLLTGFASSASAFALAQDVKDIRAIAVIVKMEPDQLVDDWITYVRARMARGRLISFTFFLIGFVVVIFNIPGAADVLRLNDPAVYTWFQQVPAAWFLIFVPLNFALIGKGSYFTVIDDRFHRLTRNRFMEIDLLHPEQLAPFTRMALRRALLWIVGSTICFLLFLNEQVSPAGLLPFILAIIAVASLALIAPLTGIHRKISDTKKRELRAVRARIAELRDEVMTGTNPTTTNNAAHRLTGLVAYEARLEKTSEWPIDLPTIGTFSFYLAIRCFRGWAVR